MTQGGTWICDLTSDLPCSSQLTYQAIQLSSQVWLLKVWASFQKIDGEWGGAKLQSDGATPYIVLHFGSPGNTETGSVVTEARLSSTI